MLDLRQHLRLSTDSAGHPQGEHVSPRYGKGLLMVDKRVPPDKIRVTDAQRHATVALLGRAFAAGCVTAAEFDDRVTAVWAAVTREELAATTADLPPQLPDLTASPPGRAERLRPVVRQASSAWLTLSVISISLWGLACLAGGVHAVYPWWIWMLGGGATLLAPIWHLVERERAP